jgi:hypothetical protein
MKKILLCIIIVVIIGIIIYYFSRNKISFKKSLTVKFYRLILVRHGEKPSNGLGNLNCKGLNRSLALPNVLLNLFNKPDFIFAPNPARKICDDGMCFNYIRPLVTIEPTAIRCNLPINSDYGYTQIHELLHELTKDKYFDKTIFIAWEHNNLDKFAKLFAKYVMKIENPGSFIPEWKSDDFDSIFIFQRKETPINIFEYDFSIDKENLNNVSDKCPS